MSWSARFLRRLFALIAYALANPADRAGHTHAAVHYYGDEEDEVTYPNHQEGVRP